MTEKVEKSADAAAQSEQYTDLRNLAAVLAPVHDTAAKFIKGTVVSIQVVTSQATCTVQLGGDATTSIPGVRILDSYSPVVGDVVQLGMQGTEIFVIGRINKSNVTTAVNGWVTPSLASGFTHSSNTVQYRVVWDNGDRKIQLRGTASVSGSPTTMWTMPTELRPLIFKSVLVGRDSGGGSNVAQLSINTSGTMVLEGRTTGVRGPDTTIGGSTAAAVTKRTTDPVTSDNGFISGGRAVTSGSTVSMDHNVSTNEQMNAHQHHFNHEHDVTITGMSHVHGMNAVLSPTVVYLDGTEYFL